MKIPNLKSLHVFAIAAKHQSFKLAAQELYVTQAAISQQIRQLEEQLQVQLFERSNKNSLLTTKGRTLFSSVERGLDHIYQGIKAVQGDVRPKVLRISCVRTFTTRWLLPNIQDFQQQHPDIVVQLVPSNALESFEDNSVDLALRMGHGEYPGLTSKRLIAEQLIMVASPNLLNENDRSDPNAVFSQPFLIDTHPNFTDALALCLKRYGKQNNDINIMMKSDDSNPVIDSAIAGLGVTILNKIMIADALQRRHLVQLLDFEVESRFSLYMVAPAINFGWRKVELFKNWLLETIQQQKE